MMRGPRRVFGAIVEARRYRRNAKRFVDGIRTQLGRNATWRFISLEVAAAGPALELRAGFPACAIPGFDPGPHLWNEIRMRRAALAGVDRHRRGFVSTQIEAPSSSDASIRESSFVPSRLASTRKSFRWGTPRTVGLLA
jgi:hypothetical protein